MRPRVLTSMLAAAAAIAVPAAGCGGDGDAGPAGPPANAQVRASTPVGEDPIEALAQRGGGAAVEPPAGGADSAAATPGATAVPGRAGPGARVSPGAPSDREVKAELENLAAIARQQVRVRAAILSANVNLGRGSGVFIVPVRGSFTSPFGPRWGRMHNGIDIATPTGTPIRAAERGIVLFASSYGGYGNFTCIGHSRTLTTCYAHQSQFVAGKGDLLEQGDVVGLVGSTGNSTGPHLHFEVRISGNPVDPMIYL